MSLSAPQVLSAHHLEFAYPRSFRLSVEELSLHAGSILGLLGPNGSGKTTLLRFLGLLMRPQAGEIHLDGQPVRYGRRGLAHRRQVASVFQRPLLLEASVRCNVEAGLRFRGMRRRARRRLAEAWLDRFGVAHLADRPARQLSGGETRRVALARAMVLEPKVLLLDEPFNDLDRESRQELHRQLRQILAGSRTAVVLVTHDLYESLGLAQRLAVMLDGRLVQQGCVDEVLSRPANRQVANVVGMTNLWPGEVLERKADGCRVLVAGAFTVWSQYPAGWPDAAELLVGTRPERIRLVLRNNCSTLDPATPPAAERSEAGGDRPILISGTVVATDLMPPLQRATVQICSPGGLSAERPTPAGGPGKQWFTRVTAEVLDLAANMGCLREGDLVQMAIRPDDIHLLPTA